MSEYLNQILYNNTQFDSFEKIKLLEPYMYNNNSRNQPDISNPNLKLTHSLPSLPSLPPLPPPLPEQIQPIIDSKSIISTSTAVVDSYISVATAPLPVPKNRNIISPKSADSLFWCMYIAKYGYGDYLAIGTKYKNKEIEKKQEMIQMIKKNPLILKSTSRKITNVLIQEIMAELMIDKKTTMNSFFAMCILNQLHVYIVDTSTKTYLEFGAKTDLEFGKREEDDNEFSSNTFILYRSVDGFYSIDLECATEQKTQEILKPFLELEHGQRPIKSISNYKMGDLESIAIQLGIWSDTKKYKKQDLYNEILVRCIW